MLEILHFLKKKNIPLILTAIDKYQSLIFITNFKLFLIFFSTNKTFFDKIDFNSIILIYLT